jgi:hypothetical protein
MNIIVEINFLYVIDCSVAKSATIQSLIYISAEADCIGLQLN